MNQTKTVGKTYARNNFASLIDAVKEDQIIFYITDRGSIQAAVLPIEKVKETSKSNTKSISELKAVGLWKDRKDIKDSVKWARNQREARYQRIYNEK